MNDNLKTNILLLALICIVSIGVVALLLKEDSVTRPLTDEAGEEINNGMQQNQSEDEPAPILSMEGARTEVPGANLVTKDNIVVTPEGKPTKNNVSPISEQAPRETAAISPDSLPKEVIKLNITATGFDPKEINVKAGEVVSIALTSGDAQTHILRFDDPNLSAVAIGVGAQETRAITFNAPKTPGSYSFYCRVLGHKGRGEVGAMIVK